MDAKHWCGLFLLGLATTTSRAGLGDAHIALDHEGRALRAQTVTSTSFGNFDRHDLVTDGGATVREFSDKSGTVFAVDFEGPTMPDLHVVLGAHYEHYEDAVGRVRRTQHNHHVMTFDVDGLQVTVITTQRGFQGRAQLPSLLPLGVTPADLR